MIEVKETLSLTSNAVYPVISGYLNKVKDLTEIEQSGFTSIAVTYVAQNYGARTIIHTNTIKECINIFLDQFSQLGVEEIKEAYRLWSTAKLNIIGSAEMYGGEFNAAQFGKIMAAYVEYRKQILAAYLNAKHAAQFVEDEHAMQKKRKKAFEDNFKTVFLNAEFKTWEQVPANWCDVARKKGLMEITKEDYKRIFTHAKQIAALELNKENDEAKNIYHKVRGEIYAATLQSRAKVISKQIAVFEFLNNKIH